MKALLRVPSASDISRLWREFASHARHLLYRRGDNGTDERSQIAPRCESKKRAAIVSQGRL
jgi:hypothetical protein